MGDAEQAYYDTAFTKSKIIEQNKNMVFIIKRYVSMCKRKHTVFFAPYVVG